MSIHDDVDLGHHGDAEVEPGLVDLAVNVRTGTPPRWLAEQVTAACTDVASYPDGTAARAAVAARHRLPAGEVLLTAGAAEAFVLLARAVQPRHAVVLHPQFTEPERALRRAGHRVTRVLQRWPFLLEPDAVPEDADLVMLGNPTNPTSVLHPAASVAALARPGRLLVVDEAFMDAVPGERHSLSGQGSVLSVPGLVVVRSLTKTWGLAGLRVGYLLADASLVDRLAAAQPHWPVSTPALAAVEACSHPRAAAEVATWAHRLGNDREHLCRRLAELGVDVVPNPQAPFLLLRIPGGSAVRDALRARGFAVRRGDTFPGLGPDWLRVAVRDTATSDAFTGALAECLSVPFG